MARQMLSVALEDSERSSHMALQDTNPMIVEPRKSEETPRRKRGFAAMDPKLVSELASRGGKAAQRAGTAHRFNSEEARVAGRKGGMATGAKRRGEKDETSN
jgi:general stress protein YciG